MRTKCYCIWCPKHPLWEKRKEFPTLAGWDIEYFIDSKYEKSGSEVDCLQPEESNIIDIEDFDFPITAYQDGGSITGFDEDNVTYRSCCENEDYKE